MIEVRIPREMTDLPYTLRLHGVTEEMYDELLNEDIKADLIDGSIGEASMFHETFGYYAQGVVERTAVLPDGWRELAEGEVAKRAKLSPPSSSCPS